ncbi:Uncharacterised protein [Moraxella caviae]|uniref:Uncharacterized protein n=1 Tax=Moraxella caviae TaxID=34060 RepID=A0A378R4M0_9GAMM|nr:Uncharacterised protein [Moraxella caviae]
MKLVFDRFINQANTTNSNTCIKFAFCDTDFTHKMFGCVYANSMQSTYFKSSNSGKNE